MAGLGQLHLIGGKLGLGRDLLGQAEVRHARLIVGVDEDVRGLEVAVQDATLVRVVNRPGDGLQILRGALGRQNAFLGQTREIRSLHEIHHQEVLAFMHADFVDGHDVGMLQARRRRGFDAEAFDELLAGVLAKQ